jgi:diguanylate cyclase (GGDEF)-like protein/PAS domain S-box-containing protein
MDASTASLLVVDDNELNRDMLGRRLELEGYRVTLAEGGVQALEFIEKQVFDLVLLDVMMPEISGLETLRRLRETHGPADLPVIMVTAKDQSEDVVEAFRLGANDYVTKPVDIPVALARIATQVSHKRAQAALRESETRYALAARGANDGLWDWDMQSDQVYYSPRWKSILGYEENEVGPEPREWFDRIHPEDLPRVQAGVAAHRQGFTVHFENEHRMLHKDNSYRWVLTRGLAVRGRDGRCLRMAGSLTDITQDKAVDPLTSLPNRVLFMDRLERVLERSKRDAGLQFAVLFLDLNRFKVINDSLGHLAGDQLLSAVARRLEACLRGSDTVARLQGSTTLARLGGDEFTILLEDIRDVQNAIRVAKRIQQELAIPFCPNGTEVVTSASIGITMGPAGYTQPDELLRDADAAMYAAKATGKGSFEVFDADMRQRAIDRLQLETDMRHGIEHGEFCLHYQPILSLSPHRVVGFEALVRWQHPQRGLMSPDDFIPIAEETGLIVPLGSWVLREACRQMSEWHTKYLSEPPVCVNVNLSSKQFLRPDLAAEVENLLKETALSPGCLKLEITESAIMHDAEAASKILDRLRTLGVQVCIDDFGTGYSSLNYLQRFTVDTLKIDRSFVKHIGETHENRRLVESIVDLAHNLSIKVVAEGVETEDQREQLKELQCEFGQGFLFSKPIDGAMAERLLATSLSKVETGLNLPTNESGHTETLEVSGAVVTGANSPSESGREQ